MTTMESTAVRVTTPGNDVEWEHKYLVFAIEREEYAVSVTKVKEIISVSPITTLPNMPHHIKGVLNLRGNVVPIVDLRLKHGLPGKEYSDRTCIVTVELNGKSGPVLMGIVVDSVNDVARIPPDDVEQPPPVGSHLLSDSISGVATSDDHVHILVDIEKALEDDAFYANERA